MGELLWLRTVQYALSHTDELALSFGQHLVLVGTALGVGLVLCVPLGVWTSRSRTAALVVINAVNAVRVIPSLAVLFLLIPYLGLSFSAAAVALTLLALPPILVNTDAAFRSVDAAVLEAAQAMGMTTRQILWRVEFPLALPVIVAGIRTAAVEVIASATLAAFVGGGGLGRYVTRGLAMYDFAILLVGAIPIALLALLAEFALGQVQRWLAPPAV